MNHATRPPTPHDLTNPRISRLIRHKARQLCLRPGFTADECPDLEHHLILHVLLRLDRYDPAKAQFSTFVARIVEREAVSIVRHRKAAMRCPDREESSLDDQVLDADGRDVARHETTPEAASNTDRLRDLERDMAHVMAHLPDDVRAIALGLAFGTQNSVGPELGISRRAMAKAVEELREIFLDAGLNEYL